MAPDRQASPSKRTCPECGLEVHPADENALLVGDQWWHRACETAKREYDDFMADRDGDDA